MSGRDFKMLRSFSKMWGRVSNMKEGSLTSQEWSRIERKSLKLGHKDSKSSGRAYIFGNKTSKKKKEKKKEGPQIHSEGSQRFQWGSQVENVSSMSEKASICHEDSQTFQEES